MRREEGERVWGRSFKRGESWNTILLWAALDRGSGDISNNSQTINKKINEKAAATNPPLSLSCTSLGSEGKWATNLAGTWLSTSLLETQWAISCGPVDSRRAAHTPPRSSERRNRSSDPAFHFAAVGIFHGYKGTIG